jgi:hypothetical protein
MKEGPPRTVPLFDGPSPQPDKEEGEAKQSGHGHTIVDELTLTCTSTLVDHGPQYCGGDRS